MTKILKINYGIEFCKMHHFLTPCKLLPHFTSKFY